MLWANVSSGTSKLEFQARKPQNIIPDEILTYIIKRHMSKKRIVTSNVNESRKNSYEKFYICMRFFLRLLLSMPVTHDV